MLFTGNHRHAIDAKGRLSVPADLRGVIQRQAGVVEGECACLYVLRTVEDDGEGALCLYTEQGFEAMAAELDQADLPSEELALYREMLFSNVNRVELDRQGRIRIAPETLQEAGLGAEVVILGVGDHIKIRDRAAWMARQERLRATRPDLLRAPGAISRRR